MCQPHKIRANLKNLINENKTISQFKGHGTHLYAIVLLVGLYCVSNKMQKNNENGIKINSITTI